MTPTGARPSDTHIDKDTTIFWFRRDLRLEDNTGLYQALKDNPHVLPIFIFDTNILDKLEDRSDARVSFIYQCLEGLQRELCEAGSNLVVLHGSPLDIFRQLNPAAVYANHDYEPYARERDDLVNAELKKRGIPFKTFKDQVVFEKDEVVKDDGSPYTIFTPYSRKWKENLDAINTKSVNIGPLLKNLKQLKPLSLPSLHQIGFKQSVISFPARVIRTKIIDQYDRQRDFPGIESTTKLSVHLRFGTVSIRHLVRVAQQKNETWLNELIWREFYHMILWHFPHVAERSFKPAYDRIVWRNHPEEFKRWCEGQTGYPIVDAGMRELNTTGFMHNRVRMIVASFLTKHLLIDWRWGEAYFASRLLDYDLPANNGGWQWAAGCGCDAAPYFRVFNPSIQTEKFDPRRVYIRKWVPEFETAGYPRPMVDHAMARDRALATYKAALE